MRDKASLDMDELEGFSNLGLGKNLGAPRHDLTTFQRYSEKCLFLGVFFSYFGAPMGDCGVMGV